MKILSIETSCDETAISIVSVKGSKEKAIFKVLSDITISQIDIHKEYGGVFPALAKREHSKNLMPILKKSLLNAKLSKKLKKQKDLDKNTRRKLSKILEREPEILEDLINLYSQIQKPDIDIIAVTNGPGLEPALWVGVNFAKALALLWDIKIVPNNHMEGHLFSAFIKGNNFKIKREDFKLPAISLLISGGHTDIYLIKDFRKYKRIGGTRDDAVGESYDKVARMLGLPYPGGPAISKLALEERNNQREDKYSFPRPMINTPDFEFSFSGLKTSVLYTIQRIKKINAKEKRGIAYSFEQSVRDVLMKKLEKAIYKYNARMVIFGGGVTANRFLATEFEKLPEITNQKDLKVFVPNPKSSTDNALMIAVAGYFKSFDKLPKNFKAEGNLELK